LFFVLAPMLAIGPALITFAVIPFAAPLPTPWGLVDMIVADLPIGILYILAFASLGIYGIVMAGWASNNKYSFLGGMRAAAQMVSYEVALGLSLIPVFMLAGNVTLTQIVWTQQQELGLWLALPLGLSFMLFVISAFAETNRLPFDVAEAESELVTGYHTEYSSMKFSMFFIAEYSNMVTASALMATLFLGGWDIPFWSGDDMRVIAPGVVEGAAPAVWKTVLTLLAFALKTFFFIFLFMWVRWTVPRFRYDQIMHLGWKVMLPVALGYVTLMAAAILVLDTLLIPFGFVYGLILTAVNLVATIAFLLLIDRDRVIAGTAPARPAEDEAALPAGVTARRGTYAGAGMNNDSQGPNGHRNEDGTAAGKPDVVPARDAARDGTDVPPPGGAAEEGARVSGRETGTRAALARHAPDGGARGWPAEVRGVRAVPHHMPVQLHPARAGRG
jgi:NADH-quinone oxidoreductase subunit H